MNLKSFLNRHFALIFGFLACVFLAGCASEEKNLDTPEGMFKYAQEFDNAERYEIALTKYADVKNKFPYSSLATEAELAIAEVHYKREAYPEAQVSYQNFRDLHPKHPKIDYVIYKTAMSYYMQLPDTIDRDLTLGHDAIYHFGEIIRLYPKSQYAAEAKQKREETYIKLAEKELYIADFYLKQKKFSAALRRYEAMVAKYSGFGLDPRAHLGAARSARALEDPSKRREHSQIILTKYPQSNEAALVKSEDLE